MHGITTHLLDLSIGTPAAGVHVTLDFAEGAGWSRVGSAVTDIDGRVRDEFSMPAIVGRYRLTVATGEYWSARGLAHFHPEVIVVFDVHVAGQHHHVPLLLSPFGYSTYRGT